MNPDEAIKELLDIELRVPVMRPQKERDALGLGREALKLVAKCRALTCSGATALLPGETE